MGEMINIEHFRDYVVQPTLQGLGLYSPAAEQLVLSTGLHESNLFYLRQLNDGPALGFYQMEPATHEDIWENYLEYRPDLMSQIERLLAPEPLRDEQLITNLAYATAMCRVHYLRVAEPLPEFNDAESMGGYWKRHYNTSLGAGTIPSFILDFNQNIKPLYE